jgi:protocatechuate 3,4-dioxygenase, beta subunit
MAGEEGEGLAGYAPYPDREHPPYRFERYRSSLLRAPARPLLAPPRTISELTGPVFSRDEVRPGESDLSIGQSGRRVLGQLMIVTGRVLDEDARPVPGTLVELWQANTAGKYNHPADEFQAPVDPDFSGCGRAMTDGEGRYSFTTIKPGAYPVQHTGNWWRPPHIHFSLFGPTFLTRLVTQMYFPGEPLNESDHILAGVSDPSARARLIATPDPEVGIWETALGYRFDLVLRGRHATPMVD